MSINMHLRLIGHPASADGLWRLLHHVSRYDGVWVTWRLDSDSHWINSFPTIPPEPS